MEDNEELPRSAVASLDRIAAGRFGLVTRLDLIEAGISAQGIRRRARNNDLVEVFPGVYRLPGAPRSWRQDLMAAFLWAGPDACASHRSAAALLGLDGFFEDTIELTTTRSLKAPPGIVLHRVRKLWAYDKTLDGAFMLTTPARTLLDIGAVAPIDRVELALEDALRRKLTTLPALRWELRTRGGQGKPGTATLKKLLQQRPDDYSPTASTLEVKVDRVLRTASLPPYERQHEIGTRIGRIRPDFAFPAQRVAVEADSYRWHSGRRAWQKDKNRERALRAAGWEVVIVTWDDVTRRPSEFLDDLRRALRRGRGNDRP